MPVWGKKNFDDVTGVSFWYKHYGAHTIYSDLTPYVVIVVNIEGGIFYAITWNTLGQCYKDTWTQVNTQTPANDSWHYHAYVAGQPVKHGGFPDLKTGLTLSVFSIDE